MKHPEADSLYVEQIDVGEAEPRTVCSGLVKYMSEDQIRGATVIVVCNLKPVTMRGVKSFAMLLCASSRDGKDDGGIEFVTPPEGSKAGERVYFEGDKYEGEYECGLVFWGLGLDLSFAYACARGQGDGVVMWSAGR
jgi:aminoacyl tRNA synthase complex-interacting multifunctional protein 1